VSDVVRRMRAIDAALDRDDGVAVFNRIYLQVTEEVLERLTGRSTFRDDAFMTELDVRFAHLWFAAHDADRVPSAWDPLFTARRDHRLLPIQYALAGMNAHIEHDLPVAVVSTCQARGTTPTTPGVREDYEQVNDLLAAVEAGIRRSFLSDVGRAADDHVGRVAHLVSSWNIDKARDVAWINVLALWQLRRLGSLADGYRSALAHTVGMGSRLLLAPLG
jgi:hypothetical protein